MPHHPRHPRSLLRSAAIAAAGALLLPLAATTAPAAAEPVVTQDFETMHEGAHVLVFSKTAGFRHDSIPTGIATIQELGTERGWEVTATEDAAQFTAENLAQYDVVVWLSTTGDVLNDEQQAAFEGYIAAGGGYAGVHAAADTEYDWAWYGGLVGAYFQSHPQIQPATVVVEDRVHPSTQHLPDRWERTDEWYDYRASPRGDVHVLASLDADSYEGDVMGADHPIAWCQDYEGGRSWYTGGGHTQESYAEAEFREHLAGGIETAAGVADADCGATVTENFDQITLARGPVEMGEPMGVAVLPDGSALHTSRDGQVFYTAEAGQTTLAADIPVYDFREDGMQGIAVDPDFATNGWVYLYYSPPLNTPPGEVAHSSLNPATWEAYEGHNNLSRFTFADGVLDPASEQVILQVPQDRGNCCHHGGEIDFDADGNLYLSTGDDTDPFESNGYAPIDDRTTRAPQFDARRTSGNTNDLRGKILRITVQEDGSYTVPDGNLFAPGTEDTRPEIYAMGFRNPFRISVDQETGDVWVGDYGPDSGGPNQYGPGGQVEFNRVTEPGNFGWPYCTGLNTAAETYADRDFTSYYGIDPNTGQPDPNDGTQDPVGAKFDCANGPANDSALNTGLPTVPPAVAAWLPYDGGSVPELGSGSESPMAGPVYRYDPELESETKFPEYYDGQFFAYEFGRRWIKNMSVDGDGGLLHIGPFSDFMQNTQLMDLEFGPEGSLYVLDYGTGFFNGDENSALYRIDYVAGTRSPSAVATATPTSGLAPLTVEFSSEGSADPDPGDVLTYAWDFQSDGTVDSTEPAASFTYTANGEYTATLTVTDSDGNTGVATAHVIVGNTAPVIEFVSPPNGGLFTFGEDVAFEVSVTDPDGQPVDCEDVEVTFALGHDQHTHGGESVNGCSGTIATGTDGSHGTDDNIFGLLLAEYTDVPPSPDTVPVTGTAELVLQPMHRQAEHFSAQNGVQVVSHGGAEGGARVGYIDPGDWISFEPWNLAGARSVQLRVSAGGPGGTVEVRTGAPDGPLAATVSVPHTGSPDNYVDLEPVPLTDPGTGTAPLYLVFQGNGGGLMDIDAFTFSTDAAACEDPGAEVDPNDAFDGTSLDRCRWTTILRPNPAEMGVEDGHLRIDALEGDMFGGNTTAANVVLQPIADPAAGFETSTQLAIPAGGDFEQAGLIVHSGDQNFAKAVLINIPGQGWRFEFGLNQGGQAVFDAALDRSGPLPAGINENAHVKIVSNGATLTAYWSADGEEWTAFGRPRPTSGLPTPRVGLAAYNGVGQPATFEHFTFGEAPTVQCDPTDPGAGYQSLFDGTADSLAAWRMAGPGGFLHADCELVSYGGLGLYWYDQAFTDYSLKLDWMMPGDDNSGIFVGFPDPGTDPWLAVNQGHEIQIDATDAPDRTTGAIYAFQSADLAARDAALEAPGEWNEYEIVVQGDRIRVYLNGELINDYTDTDPNRMNQPSFVGIQNHGNGDDVYFRNVRIQEFTFASGAGLVADHYAAGALNRQQERQLTQHLSMASRLADDGQTAQAERSLDRYGAVADGVQDEAVRAELLRMGDALRARL
ncbi:ThuA domain-containing protein [Jiangella alkaliphila]|uniref:Glucose/arabinose dehydrogenase, beta-propeller fold n=1 Tax=Jiangella alkaliphila TaxID=419479 RepID=A0A1H2JYE7_9ACTN|nr:ThuA domain-containing protein [Jiangella alkaliphila]SDU61467.1 Glucose/arabinose dehydrogenase, beta-propeller fold [Jiangella alkaliphila]